MGTHTDEAKRQKQELIIKLNKMEEQTKFQRLAEYRVNKALRNLQTITDLSSHTTYTKQEADKIINALQDKIVKMKDEFKLGLKRIERGDKPFTF